MAATNQSYGWCLYQGPNTQFICQGTADNLVHLVTFDTVQESTGGVWFYPDQITEGPYNGTNVLMSCRFTDFSVLEFDTCFLNGYLFGNLAPYYFQDCQFHCGYLYTQDSAISLINCLGERTWFYFQDTTGKPMYVRNNLFWNGNIQTSITQTSSLLQDNMFYQTYMYNQASCANINGYNGYYNSTGTYLYATNSTDVFLTSDPGYQAGPLGNYYLPTNSVLINAGSTTADLVGLYHYTTTTNQVKETNSTVDIGYHYIALGTNGLPVSTSGNGVGDYLEDANGNGTVDSGEINWQDPNDLGLNVIITRPYYSVVP
jgi:hypothetical protein